MAKRVRYPDFGRWVQATRETLGKSQLELSIEVGSSQPPWSRIEREGIIPEGIGLASICKVLGKKEKEAQVFMSDPMLQTSLDQYESLYNAYKESVVRQELQMGPVRVFILREDPEPVDYIAVGEYIDVLSRTQSTSFVLLFRSPDPRAWRSIYQLIGAIAQQSGWDYDVILPRVCAFYRHPDYAEHANAILPMINPYILTSSRQGISIASRLFDESVKQQALATGYDEPQAAQRSLCIVRHSRVIADRVANWVGFRSPFEPLPQLWIPVEIS